MQRLHNGLTVAVAIKRDNTLQLKNTLSCLTSTLENAGTVFKHSETTLFVSALILPCQEHGGKQLPETFLFTTTCCGPLSNHIEDLIETETDLLCDLFQYCDDFDRSMAISNKGYLKTYIRSHHKRSAFHSLYHGLTKTDVQQQKELRAELQNYLDKAQKLKAFGGRSAREIKWLIERHVKSRGDTYSWVQKPDSKSLLEFALLKKRFLVVGSFVLLTFGACLVWRTWFPAIVIVGLIILCAATITLLELYLAGIKTETAQRPADAQVKALAQTQQHPIINEMTAAAPLKKGRGRSLYYNLSLKAVSLFAPYLLKIPTVSNIRWLTIDKGKRLVFLSTFSNTTDFYVRDFLVGKTATGVNLMFHHGEGFPDAGPFGRRGIKYDPEGYMNAVHTGQQSTDFFYAHEQSLTADLIQKNYQIRKGLFRKMNESQAKEWLQLF